MTRPLKTIKTKYPVLTNCPIIEALIDIKVQLPESKELNDLHAIYDVIKDKFPIEKKRYQISGTFELKPEEGRAKSDMSDPQINGFLFYSESKNKIIQSRFDGFTLNKHKPYESWSNLIKEAKENWKEYKKAVEPISIKRLALRYINKIPIKTPFDPSKYFNTLPTLANKLDYNIKSLFSQITVENKDINAFANITEGIEKGNDDTIQFLLDIDVFKQGEFEDSKIWNYFEELRNFKNEIFFESITQKTLDLLK